MLSRHVGRSIKGEMFQATHFCGTVLTSAQCVAAECPLCGSITIQWVLLVLL